YDEWLDMIKSAKKTIDMETFYIANEKGEPLEKIIKEIKSAAARGVAVRIMIDSSFFSRYQESAKDFENIKNITLKKIPFGKIAGGVMHAKYFVVDGEDLFLGSQNFDWRALKHIHEMGVRIKNKELAEMFLGIFEYDWKLCDRYDTQYRKELLKEFSDDVINAKNKLEITTKEFGKVLLYPVFSPNKLVPKGWSKEETELLKIIKSANKKLCIQFFSYSLKGGSKKSQWTKIDDALRAAAKRGVDVKIVFSDWAIKKDAIEQIKELSQVQGIQIKFSTIPQYSKGFIPYSRVDHCKFFTADDDVSWLSTSNWERDYFYQSRNAALVIENSKVNAELEKVFNRIWNSDYVETVDVNKEYKSVKRN
ncbi:MAG: phospholipase D-like domain-containing protein, partial [Ignavibacteria bacterium]|nr:phospholipase D-like domain-containing protein [Ignavibacteria bacterium]